MHNKDFFPDLSVKRTEPHDSAAFEESLYLHVHISMTFVLA